VIAKLTEVREAALADLADREPDEPCKAIHGVAVLEALGFDDEDSVGAWRKLMGRPCGKVREFAEYAKGQKPEQRRNLLTLFSKRVKPVDSSAREPGGPDG